jgi:hypothetical protein
VKQSADINRRAIAIDRPLFFFTHYSAYTAARGPATLPPVPNQLLQARKAVELSARAGLTRSQGPAKGESKEEEYTREAMRRAPRTRARWPPARSAAS